MPFFNDRDEPTPQALNRLHWAIWTCIYGGLLTLILGYVVARTSGPLGWSLMAAGALFTAVGAVLVIWRSRIKDQ